MKMEGYESKFLRQREALGDQYVKAWHNEACYRQVNALNEAAMEYVEQFQGLPHPIVKAKGVAYILEHAEIYVNPEDPFGIALVAQKMDVIRDVGCFYEDRFIQKLQSKWRAELNEQLNPAETEEYLKHTRNYMLNEMYIDYNHSTPSWDSLLALGLKGILERVKRYEARLREEEELSPKQEAYFAGIYEAYEALFVFLDRLINHLKTFESPAIKHFVYEKKRLSLPKLVEVLKADWEGAEDLRREILKDDAKYGSGNEEADGLAVAVCHTIAQKVNGVPNSRGGFWKIGFLSIDKNVRFGKVSIASADGRKAGEPFSKNLNPCVGMDRGGITATINSVAKIDFTDSPHSAMIDFVLHPSAVSNEDGLLAFAALVRTYFSKGGHSVQFNIFDKEMLLAAQREPEKYRNLQVRVCGWNVYFVDLEKVLQDEFIARAM